MGFVGKLYDTFVGHMCKRSKPKPNYVKQTLQPMWHALLQSNRSFPTAAIAMEYHKILILACTSTYSSIWYEEAVSRCWVGDTLSVLSPRTVFSPGFSPARNANAGDFVVCLLRFLSFCLKMWVRSGLK